MIGVDEVGRGAWAGPLLVVAARGTAKLPNGLRDSKELTQKQREKLLNMLSNCCQFGEGWVGALEIDKHGLAQALKTGALRALSALGAAKSEEIIVDGSVNYLLPRYSRSRCLVKADSLEPIVSAASIYAKVTRDNFMKSLAQNYVGYSFEKHVGYGTKTHIEALVQRGVLADVHRLSFKPVRALRG